MSLFSLIQAKLKMICGILSCCAVIAVCCHPPGGDKDDCKDKNGKPAKECSTGTGTKTQTQTATGTKTSTSTSTSTASQGYQFPNLPDRVCTVDKFQQATDDQGRVKKLDILFVMDHSGSMADDWARVAQNVKSLVKALPADVDINYSVLLADAGSWKGRLYSASGVPTVMNNHKYSDVHIAEYLGRTFSSAMRVVDDKGSGEASFLSLHAAATTNARANQQLGFFRPDAALSILFMSDEQEIGFPFPKVQAPGLPPRCDAAYEDNVKKVYYDAKGINLDVAFNAVKALKGDMPILTSAFVNITAADVFKHNHKNASCLYDSLGYGYFEMVDKTKGVLFSLQADRAQGLQRCGEVIRDRLQLVHDFKLSKSADHVDAATILAAVDAAKVDYSYDMAQNNVHLDNAGGAGSRIEIRYCEPVVKPDWNIIGFTGTAGQRAASLQWQTPALATSSKVLYGPSPSNLSGSVALSGNATNHVVTVDGLSPNTLYYFQGVSSDNYGVEKRSSVISLRTQPDWNLVASAGQPSRNSVAISWKTPEYATTGKVRYGASADALSGEVADAKAATEHSVTVSNLNANSVYYFQVVANDEYGLEKKSAVLSVTTLNTWSIVGLKGEPGLTSVALSWQTPEYATSDKVLFGTSPNALNVVVSDNLVANNHAVTVSGLSQNTAYYFQVVGSDDQGFVQKSNVLAVKTTYDWNILGFAGIATTDSVSVSFRTPDFATNGQIRYGNTAEALTNVANAGQGTDHGAVISGLSDDTVYYFQAVATDENGLGKASGVVAIRTEKKPVVTPPSDTATDTHTSSNTDTSSNTNTSSNTDTSSNSNTNTDTSSTTDTTSSTNTNTATDSSSNTNTSTNTNTDSNSNTVTNTSTDTATNPQPSWTLTNFAGTSTTNSVVLSFSTSEYATLGKVLWGTSETSLVNQISESAATKSHSLAVAGLAADTLYYFQAVATDEYGQVKSSAVIAVRTQANAASDPSPVGTWVVQGFDATTTASSINVIWTTPGANTKATVKIGLTADNLNQSVDAPNYAETHTLSIPGFAANTTYYLQVIAVDNNGRTVESAVIMKKTKAQ